MTQQDDERPVVPVHVCYNDGEAEVVIALLRSRGIEGIAQSEQSHAVFPVIAKIRVLVDEERADEARSIIEDQLEEEAPAAE